MSADDNAPRTHRRSVSYIDKSREFYAAHGYQQAYRWASSSSVPFTPFESLGKPLSAARVAVVTTTFPVGADLPKRVYAQLADPVPEAMFTADLSWDKQATHTDDIGSFLPLAALNALVADGLVGSASPRFYGVPTEYSHRRTTADAEKILAWCKQDEVDAAVLVPL